MIAVRTDESSSSASRLYVRLACLAGALGLVGALVALQADPPLALAPGWPASAATEAESESESESDVAGLRARDRTRLSALIVPEAVLVLARAFQARPADAAPLVDFAAWGRFLRDQGLADAQLVVWLEPLDGAPAWATILPLAERAAWEQYAARLPELLADPATRERVSAAETRLLASRADAEAAIAEGRLVPRPRPRPRA